MYAETLPLQANVHVPGGFGFWRRYRKLLAHKKERGRKEDEFEVYVEKMKKPLVLSHMSSFVQPRRHTIPRHCFILTSCNPNDILHARFRFTLKRVLYPFFAVCTFAVCTGFCQSIEMVDVRCILPLPTHPQIYTK